LVNAEDLKSSPLLGCQFESGREYIFNYLVKFIFVVDFTFFYFIFYNL
jgi:hypothetical protein